MEGFIYVSNELRPAFANDLKMWREDKKVLKTNVLIWVKRLDHKILDFFGPIVLDGNSSKELLNQVNDLLKEGRIYVTKQTFETIPTTITNTSYKTFENAE